jgi:hypothetical protein
MLSEGAKGKAKLFAGTSSNKIVCDVLKKIKNYLPAIFVVNL